MKVAMSPTKAYTQIVSYMKNAKTCACACCLIPEGKQS
jgi:hypothetical protein